jgi:hypothetical protein
MVNPADAIPWRWAIVKDGSTIAYCNDRAEADRGARLQGATVKPGLRADWDYLGRRDAPAGWTYCASCSGLLNPAAAMLGPVCGQCCRENQAIASGRMTSASADRRRARRYLQPVS